MLVSATPLAQTASYWAQGGLAAVLGADDSFELHLADTERAGRGLVRRSAAEILVREAPARVRDLEQLGVHFDADRFGQLALGLEGGHSVRRVVHAGGSATGRRLVRQLSALAAEDPHDPRARGSASSRAVVPRRSLPGGGLRRRGPDRGRGPMIATGGAAALWERTTNPPGSQGVGLMLAHAAGARLADLEMLQFHPTAVIGLPGREGFLVTEAIRGEGATLHDASGERFVDELAPRDEVSRAIYERLRDTGQASVGPRHAGGRPGPLPERLQRPARGRPGPDARAGARRARGPLHDGRHRHRPGRPRELPGLYAVGEASCTGLHGANRLASNSLSECFVFAARAVVDAALAEAAPQPPSRSAASRALRELPAAAGRRRTRPVAALWREPASCATPRASSGLLAIEHPLGAADRPLRAGADRDQRRAPAPDHPERTPRWTAPRVLRARGSSAGRPGTEPPFRP